MTGVTGIVITLDEENATVSKMETVVKGGLSGETREEGGSLQGG
jgi:hypothetical protein